MKKGIFILFLLLVIICLFMGAAQVLGYNIFDYLNGSVEQLNNKAVNDNNKSNLDKGNLILVNKDHVLSENYKPDDLVKVNVKFYKTATKEERMMRKEAASALEELFNEAENEDIELYGLNGYRSYETQKELYNKDCLTKGRSYAEQYDAKPGCSEHQTGLAMDVTNRTYSVNFQLTKEGKWLAKNCYKYGFILRYPVGKENLTGYNYEPWHIRYVGKSAAMDIYTKEIVLEQYLNQ